MASAQQQQDPQAQKKRLAYSILEFLQETRNTATPEISESLEVAIQCISDSFDVSLNNESHKSQYGLPLNLPSIFGLGVARKEQIESALATASAAGKATVTPKQEPENELDRKFAEYCKLLADKNYFGGAAEGSPEYQAKLEKARAKFMEKYQTPNAPVPPASPSPSSPIPSHVPQSPNATPSSDRIKQAEEYKNLGNQKLSSQQYQEAADLYTKAIECDPTNAIYYANRAASYSHLNKHQEAIADCNIAIQKKPDYGKAYSRLGLAHFSLNNFAEATANYKKALELDPNNATIKQSLQVAEQKMRAGSSPAATSPAAARNLPDGLADIVNNPTFQNLAQNLSNAGVDPSAAAGEGRAGGMPDISQLLNNPALMNMAQNMMSQPGFADMFNNPAMMNMAQSFMQNPEALSGILQGVFGNQNNAGSGNNPPSSS